ncbi:Thioredoxin reductase [Thermovenabulum gondwanense]|uniref:Thioredoxin reductase n=1 Tax=Thermovenabulum gondwanense TaxID=520767 RepID=A0A162M3Y5_9FIRM|nr:thioredoxin-disulfide reductase [Thermovenabulum gondwanense]KYO63896.1 Thioredoxin reductase [Thermovenabulum gondwanense]
MIYDLIIIGGGPAGLSAAIYGARARLKTLVVEKMYAGGQAAITDRIENYPGFVEGIGGMELTEAMKMQAERFGAKFVNGEAQRIIPKDGRFIVELKNEQLEANAVILAMGAEARKLMVKGEKEFTGRGVSYCATCDGAFYTDRKVVVVGGGDSAIEEALYLTKFAESVTVVHRRNELRATKILQERAFSNEKIKFLWDSVVEEVKGQEAVEEIVVKNIKTGEIISYPTDGVFVAIGWEPNSGIVKGLVNLNERGYIITDENMATNVPGIFAAGDIREKSLRQVITAAADGAIAAVSAEKYIEERR